MKNASILFLKMFFLTIIITFIGLNSCKKTPTEPEVINQPCELYWGERSVIDGNYSGSRNLYVSFDWSDPEKDPKKLNVYFKIVNVSGVLGNKILNGYGDGQGMYYNMEGDKYNFETKNNGSFGELITKENLANETGPFSITLVAYDFVHDNTGPEFIIDGIVERYCCRVIVFNGVNTPFVWVSNDDYFEWSNGLTELDLGGSPAEWQKNATNSSDKNLVADNFNADTDTSMSQTYNDSDIWQDFVDAIKTGNYNVNFTRWDYTK